METETIIDLSMKDVSDEYLVQSDNDGSLHRYNREQVKKIVELAYFPHQAMQSGEFSQDDLPKALDLVGKLFDAYSAIPKGAYYISEGETLDDVTVEEAECHLESSMHISLKRFDGFVVREVGFSYRPWGESAIEPPDREIFVPWLFNIYPMVIQPAAKSAFYLNSTQISSGELKKLMQRYYASWSKLSKALITSEVKARFDEYKKEQRELGKTSKQLKAVLDSRIADELKDLKCEVYKTHAVCRGLGFHPKTSDIHTGEELFNFVERFLNFKEEGEPFREGKN